jgi:hypothetical protein
MSQYNHRYYSHIGFAIRNKEVLMQRSLPRPVAVLLGTTAIVSVLLVFCDMASALYVDHMYARAHKESGSHWDGVHVDMRLRSGSISSQDAGYGFFIANAIWAATDGTAQNEWVEAGYTRGWEGQNVMTGYWASQRWSESQGKYVYGEHRIINCAWTGGDWHWFKIMHHSGTTTGDCSWRVYVDGDPAVSADGNSISTSHKYPWSCEMYCGIELIASTGLLGTSSDWCRLNNLQATTDEQQSWSNFNNPVVQVDPGYDLHGGWNTYPVHYKDYRNY